VNRARRTLQRLAPAVISALTLGWVAGHFDMRKVAEALSWEAALLMVPALLGYGACTLILEALSIRRAIDAPPSRLDLWTAARIKCASYLLAIVNYALGGAALAVLLRRRAGIGLGEAAGVVLLISMTDLLVLLSLGASAAASVPAGALTVKAGFVALVGLGFFGGLVLLRVPASLGPLERIRSLSVFDALRHRPARRLLELLAIRILFVLCFIGVAGFTFLALEVAVPPGRLVLGMMILGLVGAVPVAVAGLGVGQLAAVVVFKGVAPDETLIALSLVLSAGLITLRAGMGVLFAREFTREALEQTRGEVP
jgi:uncharacterized membrane protein YbhN (UPF0104 family)